VATFYYQYEWHGDVELPKVYEAHEELLKLLEVTKPRIMHGFDGIQASYQESNNDYQEEAPEIDPKTTKEVFLELLSELPDEQNTEFLLEELRQVADGLNEAVKFKDVSAVVDLILARDSLRSTFDEFLDLFVHKMEASEKDKLLILILSQLGVTESFKVYSGLKQLFDRTRAKTKCIRYSLNLVSKHYEENPQEKLSCFVQNLFELLFEDKPLGSHLTGDLLELIELFVKGLDFKETKGTSEAILLRITSEYSPTELTKEVERLLVNKQSDYFRFQEWLENRQNSRNRQDSNHYYEPEQQSFEREEQNNENIDFEKKLEELRQRAKQVTADLHPDVDEEDDLAYQKKGKKEPSYRPSYESNPEADSLIRLRNNFFADADSLMREDHHKDDLESSRQYPSTFGIADLRPSGQTPTLIEEKPRMSSNHALKKKLTNPTIPSDIDPYSPDFLLEKERWKDEKNQLLAQIENLTRDLNNKKRIAEEKILENSIQPTEVLEREIIYYKSSKSVPDRLAATKRLIRAMVEREAEVETVLSQLEDCARTNKNLFFTDLKDTLQSLGSAKGMKRNMYEGLLRFALRSHTKDQEATEAVNGVINSLVVTQQLEVTIDSLVSILSAELPPMDSKFSQGSLASSRRH
jgi:hypothetical protein